MKFSKFLQFLNLRKKTPPQDSSTSTSSTNTPVLTSPRGAPSTSNDSSPDPASGFQSPVSTASRVESSADDNTSFITNVDTTFSEDNKSVESDVNTSFSENNNSVESDVNAASATSTLHLALQDLKEASEKSKDVAGSINGMCKEVKIIIQQRSPEDKQENAALTSYFRRLFKLSHDYDKFLGSVEVLMTAFRSWLSSQYREYAELVAKKCITQLLKLIDDSQLLINRVLELHTDTIVEGWGIKKSLLVELQRKAGLSAYQMSMAAVMLVAGTGFIGTVGGLLLSSYTGVDGTVLAAGGFGLTSLASLGFTVANAYDNMKSSDSLDGMEQTLQQVKSNIVQNCESLQKINIIAEQPDHDKSELLKLVEKIERLVIEGRSLVTNIEDKRTC